MRTNLSALALALLLVGCGGGGSEGYYNNETETGNSGGSDNAGNPSQVQTLNITTLELQDSNGQATEFVSSLGAVVKVKITDASNQPVRGALVNFSGENMTFSTTNGSVFTNAEGEAIIGLVPTDPNVTGAYLLQVNAQLNDLTVSESKNVSFVKTDLVIEQLKAASSSLELGGSTLLTLLVKDNQGNYHNNQ